MGKRILAVILSIITLFTTISPSFAHAEEQDQDISLLLKIEGEGGKINLDSEYGDITFYKKGNHLMKEEEGEIEECEVDDEGYYEISFSEKPKFIATIEKGYQVREYSLSTDTGKSYLNYKLPFDLEESGKLVLSVEKDDREIEENKHRRIHKRRKHELHKKLNKNKVDENNDIEKGENEELKEDKKEENKEENTEENKGEDSKVEEAKENNHYSDRAAPDHNPASGYTITNIGTVNYKNYPNFYGGGGKGMVSSTFTYDDTIAYCIEPMAPAPTGTKTYNFSDSIIQEITDSQIKAVMYYAYGNPGDITAQFGVDDGGRNIISHVALSKLAHDKAGWTDNKWNMSASSHLQGLANSLISQATQKGVPEDVNMRVFLLAPRNGKDQAMFVMDWEEKPKKKEVKLKKRSTNPEISQGNHCYSLKGAVYGLYDEEDDSLVDTMETVDEEGNFSSIMALPGSYYIKEITAPKGFYKNKHRYPVYISKDDGGEIDVDISDKPGNDPLSIIVRKRDYDTNDDSPQGGAKLFGAQYQVEYFDNYSASGSPLRTWLFETDRDGKIYLRDSYKIGGDELYTDEETGHPCLPLGSVRIKEIKPSEGYLLSDDVFVGTTEMLRHKVVETTNLPNQEYHNAKEVIKRGDFKLRKIDENHDKSMAHIPFRITNVATGENHIIVTDKNGEFNSETQYNKHTKDTNGGKEGSGLWFSETIHGKHAPVDDNRGAMQYGKYKIEELPCERNKKKTLFVDTFYIEKEKYTVELNNIRNYDLPKLTSHAVGDIPSVPYCQYAKAKDGVLLTDKVGYERLTPLYVDDQGEEHSFQYKMVSKIYDVTAKKFLKDRRGNELNIVQEFTTDTKEGYIVQRQGVDLTGLEGHTLVFHAYLYVKNPREDRWDFMVKHANNSDKNQTIYIPGVKTRAIDVNTNTMVGTVAKEIEIKDTVKGINLIPDVDFTITDMLMDKRTKKPILIDGKKVTAKVDFVANKLNEEKVITFKIDSRSLEGKDVVLFSTLTRNEEVFAREKDFNNLNQTLKFPTLKTKLLDVKTNSRIGVVAGETTLKDEVKLSNLDKRYEFTGKSYLYDDNGDIIKDKNGKKCEQESKTKGKEEITFNYKYDVDGKKFEGKNIHAGYELYVNGKLVYKHKDKKNEDQTVHFPTLTTHAIDVDTNSKVGVVDGHSVIKDTIKLKNIVKDVKFKGKSYIFNDKEEIVKNKDDKDALVEDERVTEDKEMEISYKHDIYGYKYEGKNLHAGFELYVNGVLVYKHKDKKNKEQMIHFPTLSTFARDLQTNSRVGVVGKTKLCDKYELENGLDEDFEYISYLKNRNTKELLKYKDGKVMKKKTHNKKIVFPLDTSKFAGQTYVFCTEVYLNGTLVFKRDSEFDESEAIHFPKIHTEAKDIKSGMHDGAKGSKGIIDTIYYENVIPGYEYILKGELRKQIDNKKVVSLDGKYVEGKITFKPTKEKGEEKVTLSVDSSILIGYEVVVYEDLFMGKVRITSHRERYDKDQTVNYPGLGTVATVNDSHYARPSKNTELIDRAWYKGLRKFTTYHEEAVLMDYDTQKPILVNGGEVRQQNNFIVTNSNKSVQKMSFKFDSRKLNKKKVVVFRYLYVGNVLVASHADINEKSQTVTFNNTPPSPKTFVKEGGKNLAALGGLLGALGLLGAGLYLKKKKKKGAVKEDK